MNDLIEVTVNGERTPDFAWEMASMAVPTVLANHISRIVGYREWSPFPLRRIEPPYGGLPLIIGFGEPLNLSGESYRLERVDAFVAGLDLAAAFTEGSGHQAGVQLDLTPLGAARILGMPLEALARTLVRLEDVLGHEGRQLRQRLGEANGWESRLRLVRDFALRRIALNPAPPPLVAHAWRMLTRSHGGTPIAAIADDAGVSRRHLTQQFRTWIGLPPQAYGRLLRFERALEEVKRQPAVTDWAQIAAACGYFDQPHFNRDFKAFTGMTPTGYVARLMPGGGVAA